MSIEYVQGDLLSSPASVLVIPVNCVGVAGRGLALACKQRSPEWFRSYREACEFHKYELGYPSLHLTQYVAFGGRYILDFPTKDDFRNPSRMYDIQRGLIKIDGLCRMYAFMSIAFPKLCCGAGGLDWREVQTLMEYYLGQLPCRVLIYV